jgi:hypothetical protein
MGDPVSRDAERRQEQPLVDEDVRPAPREVAARAMPVCRDAEVTRVMESHVSAHTDLPLTSGESNQGCPRRTDLTSANLTVADLTGTDVFKVRLVNARFDGAHWPWDEARQFVSIQVSALAGPARTLNRSTSAWARAATRLSVNSSW